MIVITLMTYKWCHLYLNTNLIVGGTKEIPPRQLHRPIICLFGPGMNEKR